MNFETLKPSEWHRLAPVFSAEFGARELPDPSLSILRAGLNERGGIACCYLLERVVHAGPFWVSPERRGAGLARLMVGDAVRLTAGAEVYTAATTPAATHLCESLGLVKVKGTLFCKERG